MSGDGRKPIDLYPEDLHSVALKFAGGQSRLDGIADTLNISLQNAAGMSGNDDYGHKFAGNYDPAAKALFRTLSAAVRAIGQHSTGLVTTANNYLKADHHSNAMASKGVGPERYSPPLVFTDVTYPAPASAVGAGDSSTPDVLAKYWPNGHQDKLRSAAGAYRTAAGSMQDLGNELHQQVQSITDNNEDDSIAAMAHFWSQVWQGGNHSGKAPLSAAKHACDQLAQACDSFAHVIDEAHSQTEEKLAGAGIAIGLTTAIGVLLTPFTAGGSDAGAAALDGAEASAILGGVEVAADESVAAIGTETIADLEASLDTAAGSVPEVEAVEAETAEVDRVLAKELEETEAESPGRASGSKEPGPSPAVQARFEEAAGKTPEPIPEGWEPRIADNGKGVVFQRSGAEGKSDIIRIMDPTERYPNGYIRVHNSSGQPLDVNGKPGSNPASHIPVGSSWNWWPK